MTVNYVPGCNQQGHSQDFGHGSWEGALSFSKKLTTFLFFSRRPQSPQNTSGREKSINQSINQHELAMAPHIQSSGAPEIQ